MYINGYHDTQKDEVLVWERHSHASRQLKRYPAPYYFYTPGDGDKGGEANSGDSNNDHRSYRNEPLDKCSFKTFRQFKLARKRAPVKYESDIRPFEKVLMNEYYQQPAPKLNYTFFDIEVDYDANVGFSSPALPYAPINAITLYHQWQDKYYTIAIAPPEWDQQDPYSAISEEITALTELTLVSNEAELLRKFIALLANSDVISGWNSEFFDLPYILKRMENNFGEETGAMLSFPDYSLNRHYYFRDKPTSYGSEEITVELLGGLQHMDYLSMMKKWAGQSRASWSLANISAEELPGLEKMTYKGSLEDLYHADFNYFLLYNIRDVQVITGLDEKFGFMSLANELAHLCTVPLPKTLGTVVMIDAAIMNYAHYEQNRICPDVNDSSGGSIEGALVLAPKRGLHQWVGSVDINSLYPSIIRALNISPEKITGQFDAADAFAEISRQSDRVLSFTAIDDVSVERTAAQWHTLLSSRNACLSALGVIFDTRETGCFSGLLGEWYSLRKTFQKEQRQLDEQLKDMPANTPEYLALKQQRDGFYRKQLAYKLALNSAYGASANQFSRFGDQRLGASTTATGREITSFMISKTGEILTGNYESVRRTVFEEEINYSSSSQAIIYSDTDSVYFELPGVSDVNSAVKLADDVADQLNIAFPEFMQKRFFCPDSSKKDIQCGREIVADRAIFQTKKKYLCHVVDNEGIPCSVIKAMGSDIKKSDTPKTIQKFLTDVTEKILRDGCRYKDIEAFVNDFRTQFHDDLSVQDNHTALAYGMPKGCNNLEKYTQEWSKTEKVGKGAIRMPGNVRAAINHNVMAEKYGTKPIKPGNKLRIFYISGNASRFTSIAINADDEVLPEWFNEHFTIDIERMEETLIDKKIALTFDAIDWAVPQKDGAALSQLFLFD